MQTADIANDAAVRPLVQRFERYYLGRTPRETTITLCDGAIIIRSRGALTDAEVRLLHADGTPTGREQVEQLYRRMVRQSQDVLIGAVESALGVTVRTVLCDLDAASGESVVLLAIDGEPSLNGFKA